MSSFFVTRRATTETIHGVLNAYAYHGMGVQYDPSDPANLILAETTTGFQLDRDVVDADMIISVFEHSQFPRHQIPPQEVKGAVVSARRAIEIEVEGPDYLTLSGTGTLASATAGQELGYKGGRFRAIQSGDESVGHIRRLLTVEDSENNSKRFLIELTQ